MSPVSVDEAVAAECARLRVLLRHSGQRTGQGAEHSPEEAVRV